MTLNNRNVKNEKIKQEQARYRVMRNAEYQRLVTMSPSDFEKYVADLFTLMGYETETTPITGDGGKDIILRNGQEISLVECKRYNENNKVSRPEIQKFHSALVDMNAKEGYFVTTSYFTQPAMNYSIDKSIKLIDFPRLIKMVEELKVNTIPKS
jgi:restriction endonuclease Mrr